MIFYFSGTGNSLFVARRLGQALNEVLVDMSANPNSWTIGEKEILGFVFPVYAWGLPKVVEDFIKSMPCGDDKHYTFAIFTCGDDMGYTDALLRKALKKKGWTLNAAFSLQMRNTYVCLPGFDIDTPEVEQRKMVEVEKRLPYIMQCIAQHATMRDEELKRGTMPWLKTYVIRPLFNRFLINDNKFKQHQSRCKKCGLCVKKCPLQNISYDSDGVLTWNGHCTHCLRCYHVCARHAINYGIFTCNKGQVKINV